MVSLPNHDFPRSRGKLYRDRTAYPPPPRPTTIKRTLMPYTYILKCSDGTFYTGSTWDLERRLEEHRTGEGAHYTADRLPVELVYFEEHGNIADAFNREKQIQPWSRAKKLALIEGRMGDLKGLARKRFGEG